MPIRVLTPLHLGPAFGGFRIALRAGVLGFDWPAGFAALEAAANNELHFVAHLSPERRARIVEDPPPLRPPPRCSDRLGVVDDLMIPIDDGATLLVLRAFFPFRFWPFGGWALYHGGRISRDNQLEVLSTEELQAFW